MVRHLSVDGLFTATRRAALVLAFSVHAAHGASSPAHVAANLDERIACSIAAAVKFQIPVNAMLAVAEQEAGRPGLKVKNGNGSFDLGAMQINTAYLVELKRYGITAQDVIAPGCYPYELAAWRIRGHILADRGDMWTRIANYHSRTPKYNAVYRRAVMVKAGKWAEWLKVRYPIYEVNELPRLD